MKFPNNSLKVHGDWKDHSQRQPEPEDKCFQEKSNSQEVWPLAYAEHWVATFPAEGC